MEPEKRKDWDQMLMAPLPKPAAKNRNGVKPKSKATQAEIDEDMASFYNAQKILGEM